jgi:hypothetical protein
MAGRSGGGNTGRDGSWIPSDGRSAARACWLSSAGAFTAPMKRKPLRGMVRISCCFRPLSPTAVRAALWSASILTRSGRPRPERSDQAC